MKNADDLLYDAHASLYSLVYDSDLPGHLNDKAMHLLNDLGRLRGEFESFEEPPDDDYSDDDFHEDEYRVINPLT